MKIVNILLNKQERNKIKSNAGMTPWYKMRDFTPSMEALYIMVEKFKCVLIK